MRNWRKEFPRHYRHGDIAYKPFAILFTRLWGVCSVEEWDKFRNGELSHPIGWTEATIS